MTPDRLTFVLLHGALLGAPSMAPIGQALLKTFPASRVAAFELPGHGQRTNEPLPDFTLEGLAQDMAQQIEQRLPDLAWPQTVLVGESTGALVLAKLASQGETPPLGMLLGEPPLGNGASMSQVKAGLEQSQVPAAKALWAQTFEFAAPGQTQFRDVVSEVPCPTLLVYGTERDEGKVAVPSVIDPSDLAGLEKSEQLLICGAKDRGHRVLQTMAPRWSSMLWGMLAGRGALGQPIGLIEP